MTSIKPLFLSLLGFAIFLGLVSFAFYGKMIFLNSQIAFVSSSLVMLGSMMAYKRMIDTRVEHNIITIDDSKDIIDTLEDPYDLYDDTEIKDDKEADLVETVKEERAKLKADKRPLREILKDSKASLSAYRLLAYTSLILGFLYLNRQELLHIPSYLLGLGIPPLIMVFVLLRGKKEEGI
jgi:hypothetical protein